MKYATRLTQVQMVGKFKIDPKGGEITEQQLKAFQKDPYGADLIAKGLFVCGNKTVSIGGPPVEPQKGTSDVTVTKK